MLAITAAGVALTLTAAATVYFAETYWNPGSLIQAEDRAHRIGQTSIVKIYLFYAEDTIDELLWPLLKKKMRMLGEVVGGEDLAELTVAPKPTIAGAGAGGSATPIVSVMQPPTSSSNSSSSSSSENVINVGTSCGNKLRGSVVGNCGSEVVFIDIPDSPTGKAEAAVPQFVVRSKMAPHLSSYDDV